MLRKFIAAVTAVCLIVIMLPAAFASEQTFEEKIASYCENLGDTDGNKKITVSDARKALRIAANLESVTPEALKNADIDNDGKITVADARNILRYAVNLSGFEIPNSVASKDEVLNLFVTAANKVKTENPGLTRKTTTVVPSIRVTFEEIKGVPGIIRDFRVVDMELSDAKVYMEEYITELEGSIIGFLPEVKEMRKEWDEKKDNFDKLYTPVVDTFHVKAGNSHYAQFTVKGKMWASKAELDDIKTAVLIFKNGVYEIKITYDDSPTYGTVGETLPTDLTKIPYGRMFDLETYTTYVKPANANFRFNSLKFKNGTVNCKINLHTETLETAIYKFDQIWDQTIIEKSGTEEKDSESRYVITAKNTAEYIIGQPTAQ